MAATVSVSWPPAPAASSASRRRSARNTSEAGSSGGTGMLTIADQEPCSAATTQPLSAAKADGCDVSASSKRGRPQVAAFDADVAQADPRVELPGQDGVADRGAPQHAGVTRLGVVVRQLTDRAGRLHQRRLVVKVGEGHRRSTSISEPLPAVRPVRLCRAADSSRAVRAQIPRPSRSGQDRAGLPADVFGVSGPPVPALDDVVERLFVTQVRSGGRDLGDRDGHRRVVGPLAGLERSQPTADPPDRMVGGRIGLPNS